MTKSKIFITLLNSCKTSNNTFQYVRKCVENPQEYFEKKDLIHLYNQLNSEEKDIFSCIKKVFKKAISLNLKTIKEGFQSNDKCVICGKELEICSFNNGFRFTCGDKDCKNEYKKRSFLEKYGVENPSQLKEAREKFNQTISKRTNEEKISTEQKRNLTNLERYGVENVFQSDKFKEKASNTKLEKYGDKNYNNQEKISNTKLEKYGDKNYNNQEKSKETCLEKYGVGFVFKTKQFKEKASNTKLEKYGDKNYNNQEKISNTKLEKYGDKNYNNRKKAVETNIKEYGVCNVHQLHLKNTEKIKNFDFIIKNFTEGRNILKDKLMEYFNIKAYTTYVYMFRKPLEKMGYKTKVKLDRSENSFLEDIELTLGTVLLKQYKIGDFKVDGYDPKTNTVYEFLGDYWHGNPGVFDHNQRIRKNDTVTYGDKFKHTFWRLNEIKTLGYKVKYIWEKDYTENALESLIEF